MYLMGNGSVEIIFGNREKIPKVNPNPYLKEKSELLIVIGDQNYMLFPFLT